MAVGQSWNDSSFSLQEDDLAQAKMIYTGRKLVISRAYSVGMEGRLDHCKHLQRIIVVYMGVV